VTVRSETRTGFSHFYTSNSLPPRHLLFHQQHPSQVTFFHAAEQAAELRKQACILAIAALLGSGSVLAVQKIRELWRVGPFIEELINGDIETAS